MLSAAHCPRHDPSYLASSQSKFLPSYTALSPMPSNPAARSPNNIGALLVTYTVYRSLIVALIVTLIDPFKGTPILIIKAPIILLLPCQELEMIWVDRSNPESRRAAKVDVPACACVHKCSNIIYIHIYTYAYNNMCIYIHTYMRLYFICFIVCCFLHVVQCPGTCLVYIRAYKHAYIDSQACIYIYIYIYIYVPFILYTMCMLHLEQSCAPSLMSRTRMKGVYTHMYTYINIYMYISVAIYVHACMYMYVCIYIHIQVCIYTYTY